MTTRQRPCQEFAGIESRRPSPESLERAHRATRRTWEDRQLAKKLDELLGPVDEEGEST